MTRPTLPVQESLTGRLPRPRPRRSLWVTVLYAYSGAPVSPPTPTTRPSTGWISYLPSPSRAHIDVRSATRLTGGTSHDDRAGDSRCRLLGAESRSYRTGDARDPPGLAV